MTAPSAHAVLSVLGFTAPMIVLLGALGLGLAWGPKDKGTDESTPMTKAQTETKPESQQEPEAEPDKEPESGSDETVTPSKKRAEQ